jgi:bifunctional UDP-N-acetylglucosamine pyrophosphorylase / glucosamine-1-phosphate N-acetyltransferase
MPRVPAPTVVILAAGEGTRMRSALPKMLHPLCGRPLVHWPIAAARDAGAGTVVVVDGHARRLEGHLPEGVRVAVQAQPLGTGDAVASAREHLDRDATVVVLAGDVPLVTGEALRELVAAHEAAGAAATMATMELDDPAGYGRVVRAPDGSVERVVETKVPGDATEEQLAIREVNTGILAFAGGALLDALEGLGTSNAQGERYLPDVLPRLREAGERVAAHLVTDPTLTLGVNDRVELGRVTALAQRRILERHQRAGVTVIDPGGTVVDVDVRIGRDSVLEPGTALKGATTVGERCVVGPHSTVLDCELGDGVTVLHSYLTRARVADECQIGPFAYLRPDAVLERGAKAGTFVEIKNSTIGAGAKVPHLSYLGDADVGEGTNIGAGNITANYDGVRKHRTRIGRRVKTSVDTMFVAPVTVGDEAYTAAGSVITKDVPARALGVARARQTNIEGYADRRKS